MGIHKIAMRVAEGLSPSPTGECSRNPVAGRAVISRKFFLAFRENVETNVQNPIIKTEREEIYRGKKERLGC